LSETNPDPPTTLMSPRVVSMVTSPPTPSSVTSAYVPLTLIPIHFGTVIV
jgi:hypothetical protein